MKTLNVMLALVLLLAVNTSYAQQSPQPHPPIPPIPPVPRPPDVPPVPPFLTEEQQYKELKDEYLHDIAEAEKTVKDTVSQQYIADAKAALAELDKVTDEYIKAAGNNADVSTYPASYSAAVLAVRTAVDGLRNHMAAAHANVLIRLDLMKQNHYRRFEKDKDKLNRAYDPVRKALQPAEEASTAAEPLELMVETRLAVRRLKGETITPAVVEAERLQAATEILAAQYKAATRP